MSGTVHVRTGDGLGVLTLDREPLNVLTVEMLDALDATLRRLDADPEVRIVRLDARHRCFCAGVDVADHLGDRLEPMLAALERLFVTFDSIATPTVSVVHGACLGGGMELAAATDLCVARADATFGQPEIKLGVFAPPASVLLPRSVGERVALGLLLTGETVDADRAEAIGFVNEVFPVDGFDEAVERWLGRLLAYSGAALREAKAAVVDARGASVAQGHRAVLSRYRERLLRTEDADEGLRAFLEKRPPRFRHR